MAIEVTPKKKKRIKWINYALYLSVALLIISVIGYSFLYYSFHNSQRELSELETTIQENQTTEMNLLEKDIKNSEKKIGYFSELIDNHLLPIGLFNLLEASIHAKVTFSDLRLSAENNKTTIQGTTESFRTLGEQVLVLELEPKIKNVELSKLSMGEGGNIEFEMILTLAPEVIR